VPRPALGSIPLPIQGELGAIPRGKATEFKIGPSQAKPTQAKVLTGGGGWREAQVDVPMSVSHSRV